MAADSQRLEAPVVSSAGSTVPTLVPLSLELLSPSQEAKRVCAICASLELFLHICLGLTPLGLLPVLSSFTFDSSPFPRVSWKDLKAFQRTSPHVLFLPRSD